MMEYILQCVLIVCILGKWNVECSECRALPLSSICIFWSYILKNISLQAYFFEKKFDLRRILVIFLYVNSLTYKYFAVI